MMFFSQWRNACTSLREELDDHLDAINANSRDLADVHEVVAGLDEKIEKLSTKIDELYLLLGAEQELTAKEAALQAFLQTPRTVHALAAFSCDSEASMEHALRVLLLKGVFVQQFMDDGELFFTANSASKNHITLNNYF